MVENFTQENTETKFSEEREQPVDTKLEMEQEFERKLKAHLDTLVKDPCSQTINNILAYSKNFGQ